MRERTEKVRKWVRGLLVLWKESLVFRFVSEVGGCGEILSVDLMIEVPACMSADASKSSQL